ncbi:type II secretion system F family protein [Candidatus Omnitrophota bacterium]
MKFLEAGFTSLFGKVKRKDVVTFTRELATLNKAGVPLIKCLISLRDQMPLGRFKNTIADVIDGIERGDTFSEALGRHIEAFPPLYVNMIRSGELGGQLDKVLKRLATLLEKEERLKKKIKSAFIYPAFVLSFALLILGLLMIIVIPTFTKIFSELGGDLPAPTQFLITTSAIFREYWYLVLVAIFVFIQGIRYLMKHDFAKYYFDLISLYVPVFGALTRNVAISSFARTLGTLLNSGVTIISALQIVKETQTNLVYANIVPTIIQHVKEGESISALMEQSKRFPNLVIKLVNVGEETGDLSDMLTQVADNYEEEVDLLVGALASLLEPILIIFMGLVVGFIVISMFLPLFNITKLI